MDGSQFDHLFADDECFAIGVLEARVIPVPGHTNDSVAYLVGDALFVGDSLFMPDGGTARCDFPGGDAATLYRSIQRLFELPGDTRVFVCHDYGPGGRAVACETTIGAQKRENIHVGHHIDEATFVALREARAREVTQLVGLHGREGNYPRQLSGGMQRRLGLARALVANPGLLLPEQVWDGVGDPTTKAYALGQNTDSATPLAWTHAEYLKLLRSLADGKVWDSYDPVHDRYAR